MINALGKPLPFKPPSHAARLTFFLLLSILVMVIDHRGTHLQQIRSALSVVVYPIQLTASVSAQSAARVSQLFSNENSLRQRYQRLRRENSLLLARLQKYEAVEAENARLRSLLRSAERVTDRAVVAELLAVHPEPSTKKITLNKGSNDGVYIGQPVIDAYGAMGQVTELGVFTATVTLITDASHAIPVQVNRNGLLTIARGIPLPDRLFVPFVATSVDIREGDLLVTSGMGGGFPAGYPVAEIDSILSDPNEAFLKITAQPKARLNHNKEVLLVWPGSTVGKTETGE